MADHRIRDHNGERRNFTCENWRFRTHTGEGFSDGRPGSGGGSVFPNPLVEHADGGDRYTCWLEHVIDHRENHAGYFWLMWYKNGVPTIPASGVFTRDELRNAANQILGMFTGPG